MRISIVATWFPSLFVQGKKCDCAILHIVVKFFAYQSQESKDLKDICGKFKLPSLTWFNLNCV